MASPTFRPLGVVFFANERDAPPVAEEARVHALSWCATRVPTGDFHLLMLREAGVVRRTSSVKSVDPLRRIVTTSSGREYLLHGPPEDEPVTKAQLLASAAWLGLASACDASDAFWALLNPPGALQTILLPTV